MKRPARGFEQVGHFFLSGSSTEGTKAAGSANPVPIQRRQLRKNVETEGIKNTADKEESFGAVPKDSRGAEASPLLPKAKQHINSLDQINDCLGTTLARLEVLQRSCHGVVFATEGLGDTTFWYRGTAAIIQEAMATLSEMIHPVSSPEPFSDLEEKDEAEDRT